MQEFTVESLEKSLTQDMLDGINVSMPNNDGSFPSVEEFISVSADSERIADQIFTSIDNIISSHQLPNIKA